MLMFGVKTANNMEAAQRKTAITFGLKEEKMKLESHSNK